MSSLLARPRGQPSHSLSVSESDPQHRSYGLDSSSSALLVPPKPIVATALRPPPLYSLISTGLHRCSAIGLEESLNEAWSQLEPQRERRREPASTPNGNGAKGGGAGNAEATSSQSAGTTREDQRSHSSSAASGRQLGEDRPAGSQRKRRGSPSPPGTPPRVSRTHSSQAHTRRPVDSPTNSSPSAGLTLADIESSPSLSFLATLQLRTIVYLSPSLLPAALLKLSRELDLNFLHWDLSGGRIWNRRKGRGIGGRGGRVGEKERQALDRFAGDDVERVDGELEHRLKVPDQDVSLGGLDHGRMCKATVELMLNKHCGNILICDPSGLSEVSLVVGCLRRMMRWNFASVCLEYRAFAPTRSAANNLRFIELFPLETLELPDWQDLVETAADALQDAQAHLDREEAIVQSA